MGNPSNLKSYKPGQSGNLNGRPKGSRNISTVLANMLQEIAPKAIVESDFVKTFARTRKRITVADAMALQLLHEALVKRQPWAVKEVLDRTEGRVPQLSEVKAEAVSDAEPTPFESAQRIMHILVTEENWDREIARATVAERYLLSFEDSENL